MLFVENILPNTVIHSFIHSFTLLFTQLNLCEVGISDSPERLQLSVQHFVRRVQSLQILNIELDLLVRSTAHFAFFLSRSMLLMDHKRARHHVHLRSTQSQVLEMRHPIESIVHEALDKERRFNRQFHHIKSILDVLRSLLRLDLFIRHTSHRFRLRGAQLGSRLIQNPLRITHGSLCLLSIFVQDDEANIRLAECNPALPRSREALLR